jgi:hypothetical protein
MKQHEARQWVVVQARLEIHKLSIATNEAGVIALFDALSERRDTVS